jgi:hypothetical protein
MMCEEIIALYSENFMKPIYTTCRTVAFKADYKWALKGSQRNARVTRVPISN